MILLTLKTVPENFIEDAIKNEFILLVKFYGYNGFEFVQSDIDLAAGNGHMDLASDEVGLEVGQDGINMVAGNGQISYG